MDGMWQSHFMAVFLLTVDGIILQMLQKKLRTVKGIYLYVLSSPVSLLSLSTFLLTFPTMPSWVLMW